MQIITATVRDYIIVLEVKFPSKTFPQENNFLCFGEFSNPFGLHLCFINIFSGLSSNSSDNEPSVKAAKHPQVTKILRIILERCDGEDAGATGSLNKTKTGTEYITK